MYKLTARKEMKEMDLLMSYGVHDSQFYGFANTLLSGDGNVLSRIRVPVSLLVGRLKLI